MGWVIVSTIEDLKNSCYLANIELIKHKLTFLNYGNVSLINRDDGLLVIKPSQVPFDKLKPEIMSVMDLDLNIVDSKLPPSSDIQIHAILYKNLPNIGSIIHSHSMYATAWAQSGLSVPCLGTTQADHVLGDIPCTKYLDEEKIESNYKENIASGILESCKNRTGKDYEMVLVAGHGPFTWGLNFEKAIFNSILLENICKFTFITILIKPDAPRLSEILMKKHYENKHLIH